jgi:hypothetical protein
MFNAEPPLVEGFINLIEQLQTKGFDLLCGTWPSDSRQVVSKRETPEGYIIQIHRGFDGLDDRHAGWDIHYHLQ